MKLKILIFLVLIFYNFLATSGKGTYELEKFNLSGYGIYKLMTNGLLGGKLSLPVEPHPDLIKLKDPYDPALNGPYRLGEASLYKGKYYSYFGITPVIVLFLPYKLITSNDMPEGLAILIFSFGAFLFAILILLHFKKLYFQKIPEWSLLLAVAVIGFANITPILINIHTIQAVASSSGLFFLLGGIYFLLLSVGRFRFKDLFLASIFFGFSVGARPTFFVTSSVLLLIVFFKLLKENSVGTKLLYSLLNLFLPYIICLFLLALYNYMRFQNPLEFGLSYQLVYFDITKSKFFDLQFIPFGIYSYFFQTPEVDSIFPFIHIYPKWPPFPRPSSPYFIEHNVGIIPAIPFCLMILISPIFYFFSKRVECNETCGKEKILIDAIKILFLFYFAIFIINQLNTPTIIGIVINKAFELQGFFLLLILVLFYNSLKWIRKIKENCKGECQDISAFPVFKFVLIFIPSFILIIFLLVYFYVSIRFYADFVTLIIISSAIVWFYFYQIMKPGASKKILNAIAIIFALFSIVCGMCFGIYSYEPIFKVENPLLYSKMEDLFTPISKWIASNL